jgi:glycosyltransferase involved in cell wall biosynthesis
MSRQCRNFLSWRKSVGGACSVVRKNAEVTDSFFVPQAWALDLLGAFLRCRRLIHTLQPDLCYSFLGGANILLSLLKVSGLRCPIFWGVRNSNMDLTKYDRVEQLLSKVECWLSSSSDGIVVNSRAGMQHYMELGFPATKMCCIPNGIDTDRFIIDRKAGSAIRCELRILANRKLIGIVGRIDPMKDHASFLHACALLKGDLDFTMLIIGSGSPDCEKQLADDIVKYELQDMVIRASHVSDMTAIYNALDCLCLSSKTEGFPNVVAEAMACGVPIVATDVGDVAQIVGDCGVIVSRGDAVALANALKKIITDEDSLINNDHDARALARRERIRTLYSLGSLTKEHLRIFNDSIKSKAVEKSL